MVKKFEWESRHRVQCGGRGSGPRLTKQEGVRPAMNISAPALFAQLAGTLSHDSGGRRAGGRIKLRGGARHSVACESWTVGVVWCTLRKP